MMGVKPNWVPMRDGSFKFVLPRTMEIILSPSRGRGYSFTFRLTFADESEKPVPYHKTSLPIRCRNLRLRDAFEESVDYATKVFRQASAMAVMESGLKLEKLKRERDELVKEGEFVDLLILFAET